MQKISNQLLQAITFEIKLMKKALREKQSMSEEYEELHRIIMARSTRVTQEQTDMANILKNFVKKQEARGRTALIKTLKFYLDSLDEFDFKKILAALKEEIQASKS